MSSRAKSRNAKKSRSRGREVPVDPKLDLTPPLPPPPSAVAPKHKSPRPQSTPKPKVPEQVGALPPAPAEGGSTGLKRKGLVLDGLIGEILMPGDELVISQGHALGPSPVVLGPGLTLSVGQEDEKESQSQKEEKTAIVTRAGILIKKKPNTFYIEMTARNYLPYKHEDVVGVITKKSGDQYVIDIGIKDRVTLSKFGFEGATKKNKPDLKVGDIVFGRFMDVPSDFPFEISCVSASGKSCGLGPLEDGFLFEIPTPAVKVLQTPKKHGGSDILKKLGIITPFEVAVGVNGYVWIKSKNDIVNILLSRAIQATADLEPEEHDQLLSHFRTCLESVQGIMKY